MTVEQRGEQEECRNDYIKTIRNSLGDVSAVYELSGKDTADTHPHSHEGEKETGGYLKPYFAGINGHIIGCRPIGNGKQEQGDAGGNAFQQDEAVERNRRPFDRNLPRRFDGNGRQKTKDTGKQSDAENMFIA